MHIQFCVKGIAGKLECGPGPGLTKEDAFELVRSGRGIISNWWRGKGTITPDEVDAVLTAANLNRHVHDYDNFGHETPFISLTAGSVERDALAGENIIYDAVDIALAFATQDWLTPGAIYFCWTLVGLQPAVELQQISEPIRELHIYNGWSPWQLEGEITAKVHVPAVQISRVEWWDPAQSTSRCTEVFRNRSYVGPNVLSNIRQMVQL